MTNVKCCPSARECDLIVLECVTNDHSNNPSGSGMLVPDEHSQCFLFFVLSLITVHGRTLDTVFAEERHWKCETVRKGVRMGKVRNENNASL